MRLLCEYWTAITHYKKSAGYVLIGILVGLFLMMVLYFGWMFDRIVPGIFIGGIPVGELRRDEVSRLLQATFQPMLEKKVVLTYNGRNFGVVLGAIGIMPDYEESVAVAYRIGREGNIFSRIKQRWIVQREGLDLMPAFAHNQMTLGSFYRLLEASIAVEPARSVVHVGADGSVSYTPSKDGKQVEHESLTRLLEEAIVDAGLEQIAIPVETIKPSLTEADIERWQLNQVLGTYSTEFNPDFHDRVHNLQIASNALHNVIVYPGQNFSFNTWVGPRLTETGYKEAPVILYGKLVPGIGGGVCQVTTTLYNAVILANLKIVQRTNHTLPINYVPLGRDATVDYNGIDFIFENTLDTPVLLATIVDPPYMRVAVLGKKTDWQAVEIQTEIQRTYPFKKEEKSVATLAQGERLKEQEGRDGYKIALWRIVRYPDGTEKKHLENTSIYPSRPEKYKVGPSPEPPKE